MAYAREEPWWKPKYWRKRTWAIVVPVIIIVLIIVIVVPVKVTESNRYPNYTRLDYSLADTCEFGVLPPPPPLEARDLVFEGNRGGGWL